MQCFTSPPTQYRLYGRRFLQVKRPNQQYQSTEGESCKEKQHKKHKENINYSYACTHKIDKYSVQLKDVLENTETVDKLKVHKLNTTQKKQTMQNTAEQNYPGSVTFHDTCPANKVGLVILSLFCNAP